MKVVYLFNISPVGVLEKKDRGALFLSVTIKFVSSWGDTHSKTVSNSREWSCKPERGAIFNDVALLG